MVIELVVGMVLGLAIGFGLDALFGTRPVFLVVFALLGFAAGVRTMLRTADEVQERTRRSRADAARRDRRRDGPGAGRGVAAMAGEAGGSGFNIHPMEQFEVQPLFGGDAVHWYTPTNATLWMALTVDRGQPADDRRLARPGAGAVARRSRWPSRSTASSTR